jgi:hypothetical protein
MWGYTLVSWFIYSRTTIIWQPQRPKESSTFLALSTSRTFHGTFFAVRERTITRYGLVQSFIFKAYNTNGVCRVHRWFRRRNFWLPGLWHWHIFLSFFKHNWRVCVIDFHIRHWWWQVYFAELGYDLYVIIYLLWCFIFMIEMITC